jgi:hypothetical protein
MATKILRSLQSEGGFSVAEATIIDENRNIIDVHTIKVLDNTNDKTFKKEYIVHGSLNDATVSLEMTPGHLVESDKIVFLTGFMLGTWSGYPIAVFNSNANSTTVTCTLIEHGLSDGELISVEFSNATYSSFNNNYNVTVLDSNTFTFTTNTPLNINTPVLSEELEIISYSDNWEYAVKIEAAVLSDSSNNLSVSASLLNVVKDNIPPGHTWGIVPVVNNTTKQLTFTPSYSSNTSIELRGNGIRWSGKVEITYTERNY